MPHVMDRFIFLAVLLLIPVFCHAARPASQPIPEFATEREAQTHCPHGTVVWIDSIGETYHLRGERGYGRILGEGAYGCKAEADRSPALRHGNHLSD